jgi:hypothetical protein
MTCDVWHSLRNSCRSRGLHHSPPNRPCSPPRAFALTDTVTSAAAAAAAGQPPLPVIDHHFRSFTRRLSPPVPPVLPNQAADAVRDAVLGEQNNTDVWFDSLQATLHLALARQRILKQRDAPCHPHVLNQFSRLFYQKTHQQVPNQSKTT